MDITAIVSQSNIIAAVNARILGVEPLDEPTPFEKQIVDEALAQVDITKPTFEKAIILGTLINSLIAEFQQRELRRAMARMLKELPLSPPDTQSVASTEYDFYCDAQFDFSAGASDSTSNHQIEFQDGVALSEYPVAAQRESNLSAETSLPS